MALRHRWRLAIAVPATVVAASLQVLIPRFLGKSVDEVQGFLAGGATVSVSDSQKILLTTALLLLVVASTRGFFTLLHNYQGEAIGQSIAYELRLAYYDKLQRLGFGFHDRVHSGDLITRGMLDIEGIRPFVDQGILKVIVLLLLLTIGSARLLGTDLWLGLLALSFVPFVSWRATVARLALRRSWLQLQERMSLLTRVMEENLGGIRVVRAFMAQAYEMTKFDAASDAARALADMRIGIRFRNTSMMTFAFFLTMVLVLWVGGLKVLDGAMTVGQLTEFLAFMAILQGPVRQVGMMVNAIARASTSGARLFEILDLEPTIQEKPNAAALIEGAGELRFEHVDFSYGDGAQSGKVLSDVSFTVKRGQTLGIVGPPGSGKSTIAHLIPRYYDVTGGRITINGQDIRDVTLVSLRHAAMVVQQDPFLFTAAIEHNVAYGDPWADRYRIAGATEAAQLSRYIEQMPMGYQSLVGERGVSLSGGQRQRLTIARSVLPAPAIIVFDDSTAAVDAATEQRIRAAMGERTHDQATIIIAHRLSSLMHADEILFLQDGRVMERGDHASLLAQRGHYYDLHALQMRGSDKTKDDHALPNQSGVAAS
ncbi:MAG: ABC transporter ATP-binding protein [Alphaproteobacteria bacterium]